MLTRLRQGGGVEGRSFSKIFHNFATFPQLLFACPPGVLLVPCVSPCAEVLLLEASGGLVTAPQFPRNFPSIFQQFSAIGFDAP